MWRENQSIVYFGGHRDDDEHVRWLENAGLSVQHVDRTDWLASVLHNTNPIALVADLSSEQNEIACLQDVTAAISEAAFVHRVVYLSERADQEIRLRAVQAGSDGFLVKPITPRILMQHLEPALMMARHDYRILVIADTREPQQEVVDVLQQEGMTVKYLCNTSQTLLSVINFSPDLLIIKQELPGCRGDELGRMIHQLVDYDDLPVLYLVQEGLHASDVHHDHACEWLSPESARHGGLVERVDRLICAARIRKNRISHLQNCDSVTGLLNRQGFFPLIEHGLSTAGSIALVLVELDNLQHRFPGLLSNALNSLMVMVAGQLGKHVAPADLAARIGDYTFAYLLTGKTADEVRQLGQLLSHSVISRIFDVEGHSLTFGCSIGIAISRDTLASGLPLYSLALKACEDARKAGLNRVSVRVLDREKAGLQSSEQQRLLTLMQSALDKGGFQLVYQPIASLRGRAVEKYEVLLRLDDEDRNAVPPSRFVPLAEEKGLMEAIDRWIIEQTVQTLQHRGSSARFFVKVSLNTLKAMDFLPFLEHCLARYDASGEQLVFEISAAGINDGIRDAAEFARQVVRCKCAVSAELHDINQDVSQLIEYIPASYVKLTGTTVADLGSDPVMQARLKTVVEQARRGNAMVIAGFVEDAGCLQLLWQSGVHYIQGNFLQEPNELLDFDFG